MISEKISGFNHRSLADTKQMNETHSALSQPIQASNSLSTICFSPYYLHSSE